MESCSNTRARRPCHYVIRQPGIEVTEKRTTSAGKTARFHRVFAWFAYFAVASIARSWLGNNTCPRCISSAASDSDTGFWTCLYCPARTSGRRVSARIGLCAGARRYLRRAAKRFIRRASANSRTQRPATTPSPADRERFPRNKTPRLVRLNRSSGRRELTEQRLRPNQDTA